MICTAGGIFVFCLKPRSCVFRGLPYILGQTSFPTQNPLANENSILVATARTGIRLNLGQLLIQRQKALNRLADLIFLVFAELFQNRLLLSVGHLCRSLALDDPIVHRMLSHKRVKSSL